MNLTLAFLNAFYEMSVIIILLQLKRVTNQTPGGKKKTVSSLVVVGNGKGAVGELSFYVKVMVSFDCDRLCCW